MRGDRERCIEAGMNDHIAKPINNEELSEKIHHLLAQSDTSPEVSGNDAAGIADDRSIWDKEKLLQRLRGREELVNKLCKIFYEQTDKHAAELDQLEQHFDLEDAVYITHSIKGGAANLSFLKLAEIAKKAEVAAREQDSETCKATVPEIRAALISIAQKSKRLYFVRVDN